MEPILFETPFLGGNLHLKSFHLPLWAGQLPRLLENAPRVYLCGLTGLLSDSVTRLMNRAKARQITGGFFVSRRLY